MNGMRVPVVAGVGGGVGTTTVAVGLRGLDAGRVAGTRPDILVCRATLDSLRRAAVVLDEPGPEPPPVLAVTLAARAPRRSLRAQLDLLEPDAAALVLLPHVPRWCTLVDPLAEAAQLLVEPAAQLPRPLRAYAAALRELVAAVAASGRLGRAAAAEPAFPHLAKRHAPPTGFAERPVRPPDGWADQQPLRTVPVERPVPPERGRLGRSPADGVGPRAAPAAQRPSGPAASGPAASGPAASGPYPGPPVAPDPRRQGIRIVAPAETCHTGRPDAGGEAREASARPGVRGAAVVAGRAG